MSYFIPRETCLPLCHSDASMRLRTPSFMCSQAASCHLHHKTHFMPFVASLSFHCSLCCTSEFILRKAKFFWVNFVGSLPSSIMPWLGSGGRQRLSAPHPQFATELSLQGYFNIRPFNVGILFHKSCIFSQSPPLLF